MSFQEQIECGFEKLSLNLNKNLFLSFNCINFQMSFKQISNTLRQTDPESQQTHSVDSDVEFDAKVQARGIINAFIKTENEVESINCKVNRTKPVLIFSKPITKTDII